MTDGLYFGWLKQPVDERDHLLRVEAAVPLLPSIDLTPEMPRVFDQGDLGSCTANAINAIVQHAEKKEGDRDWDRLSRLQSYLYGRLALGSWARTHDTGAYLRDVIKGIAREGVARETYWPYQVWRFAEDRRSEAAVQRSSGYHRVISYQAIPNGAASAMKACLSAGYPFAFGFDVPESWLYIGSDGYWLPGGDEEIIGGHAVVCVGYFEANGRLWARVRNSWGYDFGQAGHFFVPFEWLVKNADDLWTVRSTT